MGLADRDYMKRTPQELDSLYRTTSPSRSPVSHEAMVWIVALAVAGIALPQLFAWLGIGLPIP